MNVDGYTSKKIQEITNETTIDAFTNVDGNLILKTADGTQNNVGPLVDDYREIRSAIVSIGAFDQDPEDVLVNEWYSGTPNNSVEVFKDGAILAQTIDVAWCPNNKYLATTHSSAEKLVIWELTDSRIDRLTTALTVPVQAEYLDWSPDGQFLIVTTAANAPFFTIYQRTFGSDLLTKLPDPSEAPPNSVHAVSWSPDGQHIAMGCSDQIVIYRHSVSTSWTFTKVATIPTGMSITFRSLSWSPDGKYLVTACSVSPYIFIFKYEDGIFDLLSSIPDPASGASEQTAWSSDGRLLVVGRSDTDGLSLYHRSGDVFTKISDHDLSTGGYIKDLEFSPDNRYLTVLITGGTPKVVIHRIDVIAGLLEKIPDVPAIIGSPGNATSVDWSSDGSILTIGRSSEPYVTAYFSNRGPIDDIAGPVRIQT